MSRTIVSDVDLLREALPDLAIESDDDMIIVGTAAGNGFFISPLERRGGEWVSRACDRANHIRRIAKRAA